MRKSEGLAVECVYKDSGKTAGELLLEAFAAHLAAQADAPAPPPESGKDGAQS